MRVWIIEAFDSDGGSDRIGVYDSAEKAVEAKARFIESEVEALRAAYERFDSAGPPLRVKWNRAEFPDEFKAPMLSDLIEMRRKRLVKDVEIQEAEVQ